jgi:hypothetical protein
MRGGLMRNGLMRDGKMRGIQVCGCPAPVLEWFQR